MMKRADWDQRRMRWQVALTSIGRKLPQDSALRRILGPIAWGRYDGEPCAYDSKDNTVYGTGYLAGVRDTALRAGRELNLPGTHELAHIHASMTTGRPDENPTHPDN